MVDEGLQQLLDDDDAGHGIAGNTQNGSLAPAAQDGRLTGLDGDAVVQHLAQFPDDLHGEIFTTGGRTGVEDHHVTFRGGLVHHVPDLVELIGNDGIHLGICAPGAHHGGENGTVEFQNVAGFGVGAGRNDLVAGGDDAHHRLADHIDLQHTAGDHGADGSGGDGGVRRQDHFACADIFADLADVLPGSGGGMDSDGAVGVLHDVLHHDDGVTAFGDGVAGIHHDELVHLQGDGGGFCCTEGILGVDSHAVHGAGRIVGGADVGVDRLSSHTAAGIPDGDALGLAAEAVAFQQRQIFCSCLGKRYIGQIFKSHRFNLLKKQSLGSQHPGAGPRSHG